MAGQSTAKYLEDGRYQYIPYQQLFRRTTSVNVKGIAYEGYANRDSLKYRDTYGLKDVQTMLRGTLRYEGFCSAWNVLVQLGCCDDTYQMEDVDSMTHRQFIESFVFRGGHSITEAIGGMLGLDPNGEEMKKLAWSGLFSDELVGLQSGSPARILEHILLKKWTLNADDRDFVVMWHRFIYEQDGKRHALQAHLTATGANATETAMARTVGLPLGIAAGLIMEGKIHTRGVAIPVSRDIYEPVLRELRASGIELIEEGIEER